VVGQGVAGVEIAFALKQRFRGNEVSRTRNHHGVSILLVGRGASVIPERSARARRLLAVALQRADIETHFDFDACSFGNGTLRAKDGRTLGVDDCVWTTSSAAPYWLAQSGLSLDAGGFVQVDDFLRSSSHPQVFAAGDVAALPDPRPKAGVFAVRAGPVLAENLLRTVRDEPLIRFSPQRAWLALISLGNGTTVADKWGLALGGRWVTAWKHWNDAWFVRRYAFRDGAKPS
jgi:selenide,water dikinase